MLQVLLELSSPVLAHLNPLVCLAGELKDSTCNIVDELEDMVSTNASLAMCC